jgi:hypothetical protein
MFIPNFVNKSITVDNTIKSTPQSTPIKERISPNLYACFSNLNFAGVYRIGSESTKNNECYIGSAYNLTLKITHHLNLLLSGKHHSKGLQDWVNANGIEALDVSILKHTTANPDLFENWEQYFLTIIKPKFNTVLNKKEIKYEIRKYKPLRYAAVRILNEFGNPIVKPRIKEYETEQIVFINDSRPDDERRGWKSTIIINTEDLFSITRGDTSNFKPKKKVEEYVATVVRRNIGLVGR